MYFLAAYRVGRAVSASSEISSQYRYLKTQKISSDMSYQYRYLQTQEYFDKGIKYIQH